jgi:hypothetical protein
MDRRSFFAVTAPSLFLASCFGPGGSGRVNYGDFDSVMIEPVATRFSAAGTSSAVTEQVALHFRTGLRTAFGKRLKLVGAPGPRTMRVRAMVSDGDPSAVLMHHANPAGRMQGAVGPALPTLMMARLSAEILDAKGQRLAAVGPQAISSIPRLDAATDWLVVRTFCETTAESLANRIAPAPAAP